MNIKISSEKLNYFQGIQLVICLLLIQLIYGILYEKYSLPLSSNQFVSFISIFGISLILLKKPLLFALIFHPMSLIALIPPLTLWFICYFYHDYPFFEPSVISFTVRFYSISLFGFLASQIKLDSQEKIRILNIILIFFTIALALFSMQPDRSQFNRLTFIGISTTSAHVLAVMALISFICIYDTPNFNIKNKITLYIIYCLIFLISIQTQSRGGLISLCVIMILTFIFMSPKILIFFEKQRKVIICCSVIISISLLLFFDEFTYFLKLIFQLITSIIGRGSGEYEEDGRVDIFFGYTEVFISHSNIFMFGVGLPRDSYDGPVIRNPFDSISAAHNYIYGSISIGGIIYFISLMLVIVILIVNMIHLTKKYSHWQEIMYSEAILIKFTTIAATTSFLLMGFTDNFPYLFSAWPIHGVWGIFFFCAGLNQKTRKLKHFY